MRPLPASGQQVLVGYKVSGLFKIYLNKNTGFHYLAIYTVELHIYLLQGQFSSYKNKSCKRTNERMISLYIQIKKPQIVIRNAKT